MLEDDEFFGFVTYKKDHFTAIDELQAISPCTNYVHGLFVMSTYELEIL